MTDFNYCCFSKISLILIPLFLVQKKFVNHSFYDYYINYFIKVNSLKKLIKLCKN